MSISTCEGVRDTDERLRKRPLANMIEEAHVIVDSARTKR